MRLRCLSWPERGGDREECHGYDEVEQVAPANRRDDASKSGENEEHSEQHPQHSHSPTPYPLDRAASGKRYGS